MSTNKNNISYSASDIEKYRKGELSAVEMHDLEQAALDDPFLADAIEGLIQHPVSRQDLTDIQDRLNKKVTEGTRRTAILLMRRRITTAAAVVLLVGVGFTFLYRYSNHAGRTSQPSLAVSAKAPEPAGTTKAPEPPATTNKADSARIAFTQPRNTLPRTSRSTPTRRHRLPATSDSIAVASAAPPVVLKNYKSAPITDSVKLSAVLRQNTDSKTYQLPKKDRSTEQFLNFRPTEPLVYIGKVLDINNRPLAGASLTLKGNLQYAATTDKQGLFKLSVPQVDSTLQLTVSLIGYDQTSLNLNSFSAESRSGNVIFLKPSNAGLDEVVVTGYGARRKMMQATAPSVSNEQLDTNWNTATPVIGRPAYLQYIQASKGKLGLDSTITGTETVSFIVSRDGSLSSFKIEQSLSPAHDAAIIRLVTDGPAWRLIRAKKIRAAVTVNF